MCVSVCVLRYGKPTRKRTCYDMMIITMIVIVLAFSNVYAKQKNKIKKLKKGITGTKI